MSKLGRLNRGETNIDFLKWWKIGLAVSVCLIVLCVGSLLTRGLNLGIDFKGSVSWEVSAPGVSIDETRTALESVGEGLAKIQIVGTDIIRVQGPESTPEHTVEVTKTLAELANTEPANVSFSTVGASWGGDVTRSAIRALVFFFIAILIYLTIRLEWRMAVAALIAVIHDVLISVGAYSVFQFEVTPGTVIAFLTILGYSIYDTIVVDDKIKENERFVGQSGRLSYGQMTSMSMNQVLLRSINTTVVSLLPVIALLVVGAGIMGAVTLEEFSIALTVGLLAGAYSSIFVAAPILVWLKEHQSKYKVIRERLQAQGIDIAHASARVDLLGAGVGSAAISAASKPVAGDSVSAPASIAAPSGVIPPRPRKNQRKR
jgi:preprotein translocase subunit SecF